MQHSLHYIEPSTELSRSVDKEPFLFRHNLSNSQLFSRAALKRLVEQIGALPPKNPRTGRTITRGFFITKDDGKLEWGTPEFQEALNKAYDNIDFAGARIKLSSIHQIDAYAEVLAECVTDLSEATGVNFHRRFSRAIATLFITSPGETTPYHIDQEVNFLLQIAGEKHVNVFDGSDRKVVTHQQLEGFWTGKHFIEQQPDSVAKPFLLRPGFGVHHPAFFPHNVQVGDQMSVSLSLGFQRAQFTEAEVYLLNAYLRKIGMKPHPPGVNRTLDALKSAIARPTVRAKNAILGSAGIPLSSLKDRFDHSRDQGGGYAGSRVSGVRF
jgi:hypothetical protein